MTTHAYQFGGRIFRQKLGAPIGLRASAVLAKLCMAFWDVKWAKIQTAFGLVVQLMFRYMDDIRVYLHPIRACWEWTGMGWMKKDPDSTEISEEKRTEWSKEQIKSSFEGIFGFLKFTTEDQEEFNNKMLPTLDVQTRVENDGRYTLNTTRSRWLIICYWTLTQHYLILPFSVVYARILSEDC